MKKAFFLSDLPGHGETVEIPEYHAKTLLDVINRIEALGVKA